MALKNPAAELYILVGILLFGIILLLGLFFGDVGIYGNPYLFINPRTGEGTLRSDWLNPDINYYPYLDNEPIPEVQLLMDNLTNAIISPNMS